MLLSVIVAFTSVSIIALSASADIVATANAITLEATRPNVDTEGRALPLASHWTTGKHPYSEGYGPIHQMEFIDQGHYILPWFAFPTTLDIVSWQIDFTTYYEAAIKQARDLNLPLVFVGTQWEHELYDDPTYFNLPASQNPNVVTTSGDIQARVSPFGPVAPWGELGVTLTDNPWFDLLQEWYPNPPKVIFLSNNEAQDLRWINAETSQRYVDQYGLGRSDEFKRQVVGDGWIPRYRAMQEGMRSGLKNTSWQDVSSFVAYDAAGPRHIGRWYGWAEYSLTITGRVDPSPLTWDGGSLSYYTDNWNPQTDFNAYGPPVEFMNMVFQLDEAYALNPDFWFEMSVWDGHTDDDTDKWLFYENLGQTYTPERHAAFTKIGMWLTRPRVVREFRGWLQDFNETGDYFLAISNAVNEIHDNAVLRDFWRIGELVPNRAHQHFYQSNFPAEYADKDRWFLLDSDVNPEYPIGFDSEISVFTVALVKGQAPNREWLVSSNSPLQNRTGVWVTLPEFGDILLENVAIAGSYYVVNESTGQITPLADVGDPPPPPPPDPDVTPPTITAPADVTVNDGDPINLGNAVVSDNEDPNPVVSNNAPVSFSIGVTVVTWTATDASGNSASDTQNVEVLEVAPPPPNPNEDPIANAGLDRTVNDSDGNPGEAVTLNGSGSTDSDGTIVSYDWSWNGGSATGVSPTVNLSDGRKTITLVVTDNDGASDSDTVLVNVKKPKGKGRGKPTK